MRGLAADVGLVTTGSSDYHGTNKTTPIAAGTTPAPVPEPVAAVEPTEHERAPEVDQPQPEVDQPQVEQSHVQQLALLDVEREVADEAGAEPLRAPEVDPAVEQARVDAVAAERDRQEHARVALTEARWQTEAADAQRQAREAAAATEAPLERARQNVQAAMAACRAGPPRGR